MGFGAQKTVLCLQKVCIFECPFVQGNPPITNLQNIEYLLIVAEKIKNRYEHRSSHQRLYP